MFNDGFYFLFVLLVALMKIGKQSFRSAVRIVPDEFLWLVELFGFQNHFGLPHLLIGEY